MVKNLLSRIIVVLSFVMMTAFEIHSSKISFTGFSKKVIEIVPDKSTGLDAIFVAHNTNGLKIIYNSQSAEKPTVMKYGALGGGYAEPVTDVSFNSNTITLTSPEGNLGYIIEDGDYRYYFWLVDYSSVPFDIQSISLPDTSDCDFISLTFNGTGDPIHYYSINGRQLTLNREILLTYETLEWDEENKFFNKIQSEMSLESIDHGANITPPPYCNTYFHISGDRFLKEWGIESQAESELFKTTAVKVEASAIQTYSETDNSNQIGSGDSQGNLGGSAPADINFTAYVSDAVVHDEWQIASDPDFFNLLNRFNVREFDYSFREEGVFYVRFIGSNNDGSCEAYSQTFEVNIGASELICPNAFSPGASEGVNDEWKVSYKSLIEFKCWIFDRYGTQIFYFDSPDMGWDGKYRGKLVKPGVYYYVIEAKGADGRKYKRSGDINILRFKKGNNSQQQPVEP